MAPPKKGGAGQRLGVYSLGFIRNWFLREMLEAAGWDVVPGPLSRNIDAIAVWGDRPVAKRGLRAAKRRGLPVVYIEDAFIRSVSQEPGWPVAGISIDLTGNHIDCARPSDLETLLNGPISDQQDREAELVLEEFLASGVTKFSSPRENGVEPEPPDPGFVLVVDQVRGDASIRLGGARASTFSKMLEAAIAENPGRTIYVRRHPRAEGDPRLSHFQPERLPKNVRLLDPNVPITAVLDRAGRVYCVTSQVGFEAILRGHRPQVFGGAFYAGWGLSDDRVELPRRRVTHSPVSLFRRVMMDYPFWYDPYLKARTDFTSMMHNVISQRRGDALRQKKWLAIGFRPWKRAWTRNQLGDVVFRRVNERTGAPDQGDRQTLVWASKETEQVRDIARKSRTPLFRMEDGFLRSVGLGAELTPALSFCLDDLGIYYDPSSESRLERLIGQSANLSEAKIERARDLRANIVKNSVTKYNVGAQPVSTPGNRRVVLAIGQVENDASILKGASEIRTNLDLLKRVRLDNEDAFVLYKPHPDVEAGLRAGGIPTEEALRFSDVILENVSASDAIIAADEVWTITSLIGFEALMRGTPVTCVGRPFYAGWGLTNDLDQSFERRSAKVSIDQLVYAALIDYPYYFDPVTRWPCTPETVLHRLAKGGVQRPASNWVLSKLQGVLADWVRLSR